MDIQTLRNDFPALRNYTWFQNGGVSMTPAPVAKEHARLMQELLERGPMHIVYPDEEYPRRTDTMARLARFFSVSPDDLALMRGVSEAFQTVLRGLSWRAGDQIIITADEEAALLLPALHLRERFGVEVVKVPLIDDYEGQIEAVTDLFTDRTRLVALSHVTTDMGWRLPVEPICAAARERGILTFLDLAHSAGLYPMPLHDLNCDYAGILSYKWMYAPYASGMLYEHPDRRHALEVTYAGGRSEARLDFEQDQFEMRETAERFQYGPWSWPLVHAWAFSADYLQDIGLENIWNRTVALTTRLKEGLKEMPGAELYTPASPDLSAALVTFGLEGHTGEALTQALRDRNIIIKPLPHTREGLRASMTFFTLEEEVDLLLEAVKAIG